MKKATFIIISLLLVVVSCKKDSPINIEDEPLSGPASFPGAEGFGRYATGGRGGDVVYVTNLNSNGPGSLNDAFCYHANPDMQKPRYILFKVSGIVTRGSIYDHGTHIEYGDFTLAGHTSKGGIILGGLLAWDKYELGNLKNYIIRHIRSRPSGIESGMDDAIRLNNSQNFILDHCSFAWAGDECMQIAANKNATVQNCIFAETLGEHNDRGGVLIKYSEPQFPNTGISFHHNMFSRIGGRLPQLSPNNSEAGRGIKIEISNNLIWDPGSTMGNIAACYITNFVTEQQIYVDWWCHLNYINNYTFTLDKADKEDYWTNVASIDLRHDNSQIYVVGNQMNIYDNPNKVKINETNCTLLTERHDFPEITYHQSTELMDYMVENAGAFPRDAMDSRFIGDVASRTIDPTPCNEKGADDGHLFNWTVMPIPDLDSDDDGMPDWWEIYNGLDPLSQDHNGKDLSAKYTEISDYDNLEVYLNRLSDHLVKNSSLTVGDEAIYENLIDNIEVANTSNLSPGGHIDFAVTLKNTNLKQLEVSLDLLTDPFAWPSPDCTDISSKVAGSFTYSVTIPAERTIGKYSVMFHALSDNDKDDYMIVNFELK